MSQRSLSAFTLLAYAGPPLAHVAPSLLVHAAAAHFLHALPLLSHVAPSLLVHAAAPANGVSVQHTCAREHTRTHAHTQVHAHTLTHINIMLCLLSFTHVCVCVCVCLD